jgi:hypothetical protein
MTRPRTVVLDNEAVQALSSSNHPKHARVIAHVQVVAQRKVKAVPLDIVVPTAVRVEAGWDRRARSATLINHLRIADAVLDTTSANVAAALVARLQVSVADAHVGASVPGLAEQGPVTVITRGRQDIAAVADPVPVTIVSI